LGQTIGQILDAVGVRKPDGRRPRLHDFRHTFAVHALLRWYRAGEDVQAKLPLLATYMGHVSAASTHYYLKVTEPLVSSASERFARRYAKLIEPLPIVGGRP
jgi:integrase